MFSGIFLLASTQKKIQSNSFQPVVVSQRDANEGQEITQENLRKEYQELITLENSYRDRLAELNSCLEEVRDLREDYTKLIQSLSSPDSTDSIDTNSLQYKREFEKTKERVVDLERKVSSLERKID